MKFQVVIFLSLLMFLNANAYASVVLRFGYRAPQFTLNGIKAPKGKKYKSISDLVRAKYKKNKVTKTQSVTLLNSLNSQKEIKENDKEINLEEIKKKVSKKLVKKEPSDDLVFYDYTTKKPGKTTVVDSIQTVASAPISDPIKTIIEREIKKNKRKKRSKKIKKEKSIKKVGLSNRPKNTILLQAIEVDINTSEHAPINNFQFKSLFHQESNYSSDADGIVDIEANSGIIRGYILHQNSVATKVEIPLGHSETIFEVPMITYDSLREYLSKSEIEVIGGMYLSRLSDTIVDIDLDTEYERRVLINENFEEVKPGDEYRFVLFIGVTQGNIEVKALTNNNEVVEKIVTITPDEVLYDVIDTEYKNSKKFDLEIENTMSKIPSKLNLPLDDIKHIIGHGQVNKTKAAQYEVSGRVNVQHSQSYFEANFLDDKIYFSLPKNKKVTLPSNEFIAEVLNQFDIEGLEDRCLVQVNLKGEKESIFAAIDSDRGNEPIDILYLDKDGIFTDEVSPATKQLFILGTRQGTLNLKFVSSNKNVDYKKSVCSSSTYLVEHF